MSPDQAATIAANRGQVWEREMKITRAIYNGKESFLSPAMKGDFVMHFPIGHLAGPSARPTDFWLFGQLVEFGIVSKFSELPAWFTLHPSEMQYEVAEAMIPKLQGKASLPDPVYLPNLWRAKAGDRIAYFFERPWTNPSENGIVIDIAEDALVFWRLQDGRCPNLLDASGESPAENDEKLKRWMVAASNKVVALGLPRACSLQWGIGCL